jgi:hypothetical protein
MAGGEAPTTPHPKDEGQKPNRESRFYLAADSLWKTLVFYPEIEQLAKMSKTEYQISVSHRLSGIARHFARGLQNRERNGRSI